MLTKSRYLDILSFVIFWGGFDDTVVTVLQCLVNPWEAQSWTSSDQFLTWYNGMIKAFKNWCRGTYQIYGLDIFIIHSCW